MGRTTLCGWRKGSHISNSRRYVMAQERPGERLDQRKLSVFGGVTLRNLFLIAAGALLFFWPLAQRAFASIVACSGCSCVSEVIDGLASCTAIAQCIPEFKLLIVNASIEYLCPGQPVANQATTTGYIGGYNIFATTYAQAMFSSRVCTNRWALEQCDGYQTSGITSDDLDCCSPPPPPPPDPCLGGSGPPIPPSDSGPAPVCSPIILDLSGDGFSLTDTAHGVLFDISGTGKPIQIAWIAPGADNAFLALDRDGDGIIKDGTELFGNFTPQPQSPHPNGFLALAVYDQPANGGNGDGIIDSRDAVFTSLRLWIDT